MLALYALMQFVFSPVLGVISDRYGRRPVLLLSLAGSTIDYLIMAFTPYLWLLFAGRAMAGLTSANTAIATAYITDITPEAPRAPLRPVPGLLRRRLRHGPGHRRRARRYLGARPFHLRRRAERPQPRDRL